MEKQELKILIPKGRIFEKIRTVLNDAGYNITNYERDYRPTCNIEEFKIKLLKPQNIAKLIELGNQDIGFTGVDWVIEREAEVEEILDLGFDPVRIIAAVPKGKLETILKKDKIIVATEYPNIAKTYLEKKGWNYVIIQTTGATEVFPPEDADMIIDNTSTGKTLVDNNLEIIDEVMTSSTRLIANKGSLTNPWKQKQISKIQMMIQSVLLARDKVLLEMNISKNKLSPLLSELPSMKSPTISSLSDGNYSVKTVIRKINLTSIVPKLKELGATDILELEIRRIVE